MTLIGSFIAADNPGSTDAEQVARDQLAHELMYFSRGNPVIYYGDEQGFTGDGDDRRSRQDMFETQTPSYADDRRIGTASGSFDTEADLYRRIVVMTAARAAKVCRRVDKCKVCAS